MRIISSIELLQKEYEKRKSKNPKYSLRAFARDLGISRTVVSDVVRGERRLSHSNIKAIAESMELDASTVEALKADLTAPPEEERDMIRDEDIRFIESWHYLAILNLAKLKVSQGNAKWIARRLGLTEKEAQDALDYLLNRGFISLKDGKMIRRTKLLTTSVDIPSSAIVESHRQSIQLALEALEDVSVENREYTTVTYAIDPSMMKEAKEHIVKFHRRFGKILDTKEASEVYRLNIQFFPLTKIEEP